MSRLKEREWKTLRQVFSKQDYPDVIKSERPDFIIYSDDEVFGVEVTEYYQDNTSASYANTPDYLNNILEDERNIKKRDKLKRAQLCFEENGASDLIINGVWRAYQPPEDRLKRLNSVISKKSFEHEGYDKSLKAIDLIVHDQGDLFGGARGREVYAYLQEQSRESSIRSPFRNIYISRRFGAFDVPITFKSREQV